MVRAPPGLTWGGVGVSPPPPPGPTGSSFGAVPGPTGREPVPARPCEQRLLEDCHVPGSARLEGGSSAQGRCRARPVEHRGYECPTGQGWRAGEQVCLFQGEETEARETGRCLSWPLGTARKPSLSCAPDLSAPKDSPPQCHVPQQGRSSSRPPGSHFGTCKIKAAAARLAPVPPASSPPRPPSRPGLCSHPR